MKKNLVIEDTTALRQEIVGTMDRADSIAPQEIVHVARVNHQSAQRLERLMENYWLYFQLELIAAEQGRLLELREARCRQPRGIIKKACAARAAAVNRNVDLHFHLENAPVHCSPANLEKIVFEVIDNALKFSNPQTPIQVEAFVETGEFTLQVTDQGCGMTQDQIDRLRKTGDLSQRAIDGEHLGLGLIITAKLAELCGGSLEIDSLPEVQTTVRVTLPA